MGKGLFGIKSEVLVDSQETEQKILAEQALLLGVLDNILSRVLVGVEFNYFFLASSGK